MLPTELPLEMRGTQIRCVVHSTDSSLPVAVIACCIRAGRATRVNPVVLLRNE